jgi:2-iminobutanoate/2-iminopropanoate deaminase
VKKELISAPGAPPAVGPYSHAVKVGDLLFVSGQIPLDAATGQMVKGDILVETRQVMENLGAILTAAGATFEHVVKATIYMQDLGAFAAMNGVYAAYFPKGPPARVTVQVAALPRGAQVEIDLIAHLGAE